LPFLPAEAFAARLRQPLCRSGSVRALFFSPARRIPRPDFREPELSGVGFNPRDSRERSLEHQHLRVRGVNIPNSLLVHVAPLSWEHIALTGDYVRSTADAPEAFRPLRDVCRPFLFEAA
jgi:hypothetical protein